MSRYAEGTSVPVERSRAELERTLARYGAEKFAYFTSGQAAAIAFQVQGRAVRMKLELPSPADFIRNEKNKTRTLLQRDDACAAAHRQRWRALVLVVKAKLEAIESGIATFEDEWLAYLVLPDGKTVAEQLGPQLDAVRALGGQLLLGLDEPKASAP